MKKFLGLSAGLVLLVAIISGASSDKSNVTEKASTAVQPMVSTVQAEEVPPEAVAPQVASAAVESTPAVAEPEPVAARSNCDSNYSPCVPNVSYDLDCGDISFSVTVIGSDPHRFDRDGDGYGCESN